MGHVEGAVGKHSQPADDRPLTHRARSRARWLVLDFRDAFIVCVLGLLAVSVAPVLVGWKSTVVVSGSMMPKIHPGDVVSAAPPPDKIAPGTVVLVNDPARPDELLMHRVLRLDDAGRMITKGDANQTADTTPVPMANLVGVPRMRIPWIGLPYLWIRQGHYLPVGAAGVLLMALLLWRPTPGDSGDKPIPLTDPAKVLNRPVDADVYRVRHAAPTDPARILNSPVDADWYRFSRLPTSELVSNSSALLRYSNPSTVPPNWTCEAAAAVSTGER
ncbi:signal peptidase I [Actinoplanes sp. TRM 88003]|uniref:Signal peptidase I n=1 Tax=Paractinoplanes aksuensis TaxID=2939490 RepID=A0ABT1DFD9_9ACTN|nr:signal peptidase I [Actinoplanes aksuensis]MCO8269504.1 signal peptidase I [Actinoplanes aksuensis]